MNRPQSGAALLLCVLLLASLSLLGLSTASETLLQERMGANRSVNEQDLHLAMAGLRALEILLLSLPGATRPAGCPDDCLAILPPGTEAQELHHQSATAEGQLETSWFQLEAAYGTPPVVVRSILARPWGDAAWSDGGEFCALLEPGIPCGRMGWEQMPP
jgi:Tfp pilus assembly protein PilX